MCERKGELKLLHTVGNEPEKLIEIQNTQCCESESDSDEFKKGRKRKLLRSKRKLIFNKDEDELVVGLIKAVYQREPLWNSTLPYEKRGYKVTSVLWSEIDQLLNLTNGDSQTKFKNLRDRYVRLASEKMQQIDHDNCDPPQWKYYELLQFLQPTIVYRASSKKQEISTSPNKTTDCKNSNENGDSSSITKSYHTEENNQMLLPKSNQNYDGINMSGMSPFEIYCIKQLELLNKPTDQISTFCAYLESELRNLSDQKVENIKENILYLILQAKKGHIK